MICFYVDCKCGRQHLYAPGLSSRHTYPGIPILDPSDIVICPCGALLTIDRIVKAGGGGLEVEVGYQKMNDEQKKAAEEKWTLETRN